MKRQVLLLNQSEEILKVISWKKAISLLETGKQKDHMVMIRIII